MSLKSARSATNSRHNDGAWSLAARLTAWYAGSAFALVLAATGFLYWALSRNLDREDDQLLADAVRDHRAVLPDRLGEGGSMRQAVEAWKGRQNSRVYARIMDGHGSVVVETPGMEDLLPSGSFPAPSTEPGEGADRVTGSGRSLRVLAVRSSRGTPNPSERVIQVAMDRTQEVELLAEYRKHLWVVLGASLVLCSVVGHRIARRGIRPIDEITRTARRIRPNNLGERIDADGLPAELLTLAGTFNEMLDRLEQSFARLSRFSADIAHELRTPINNLRGEVEVALGKPRSSEEYRDVLGSNLEECGRLARMIDSLLFLARAEKPQAHLVRERFDVGRELGTVCEFFEATASEAGVSLTVDVEGHVLADINRPLFQRAVGNLVGNAIAHTPPGGAVTLAAAGDVVMTRVEVADTGCGIPAAHLPHVFDRFYRGDDARSSASGRVGLGLAIVRSIVELHGGSVEIASVVGQGTRAVMTFPRSADPAPACVTKMTEP